MIDNPTMIPDLEDLAGEMCFIEKRAKVCERLIESYRQDGLLGSGPTRENVDGLLVIAADVLDKVQQFKARVDEFADSL